MTKFNQIAVLEITESVIVFSFTPGEDTLKLNEGFLTGKFGVFVLSSEKDEKGDFIYDKAALRAGSRKFFFCAEVLKEQPYAAPHMTREAIGLITAIERRLAAIIRGHKKAMSEHDTFNIVDGKLQIQRVDASQIGF